jgi:hypothetical protein
MRIDIKKVKNRKYLQFVRRDSRILHIGSASSFDSWLVAVILWNEEWKRESGQKRRDFFDTIEYEMEKHVSLDSSKLRAFEAVRFQDEHRSEHSPKPLRVPKIHLFGHIEENSNAMQRRYRQFRWCPNEWGVRIQKRLDEIQLKERHFQRKTKDIERFTEKYKRLQEIRTQCMRVREQALREENSVLSVLLEMEKTTGIVRKTELMSELARRHKTSQEESEQILMWLLQKGVIFEPKEGYLKKT